MEVNFYCSLTAPAVDIQEQEAYLKDFLRDVEVPLANILHVFLMVFYKSPLAPEPPVLPSYTPDEEGVTCTVPFQFQYLGLQDTHLRLQLLQTLLDNFCYGKGVVPHYEFHLGD